MSSIKRIDILFFVYLAISTIFLMLGSVSKSEIQLLGIHTVIALLVTALIYFEQKTNSAIIRFIRAVYPIVLSGYFYSETVFYNQLFFHNIDPLLAKIDFIVFTYQPSIYFSQTISNIAFSELMYFSYFLFYILIITFIIYIFCIKNKYFHHAVFQLSTSLYLFYFLFILIPSAGPQFYFSSPDNDLPSGVFFSHIMHFIQDTAEQPTGAFPSSHVGISIIILMLSKRIAPQFFKFVWPFVILILLSTIYIKAHYVIDVLGGVIFAPIILYLSNILYKFPNGKSQIKKQHA